MKVIHFGKALCCLLASLNLAAQLPDKLVLPLLFTDNMVLQREVNIPVWGVCTPHDTVSAMLQGYTIVSVADHQGKWKLYLPALPAGGPYQMRVRTTGSAIEISNVMIGEVWLASGQSNMNYRLKDESESECAAANYPAIREFDVPENVHQFPQKALKNGQWKICTPANARQFSAVAYAFAKNLHLDKKVAVGVIHASRGGTMLEAWLSSEIMMTHPAYRQHMLDVKANPEDWAMNQRIFDSTNLLRSELVRTASNGIKLRVHRLDYKPGMSWHTARYPLAASDMAASPYHFIWLRKTFESTGANGKCNNYTLSLGQVVSNAYTIYLNGTEVGSGRMTGKPDFIVSAALLKRGTNLLAIRFLSEYSSGKIGRTGEEPGIYGANNDLVYSLNGEWQYNIDIEPLLPWFKSYNKEPGIFFNGMINPLIPYAIKGVLWYQGENNWANASSYSSLLPLLFEDWRTRWQQGYLPFLIVQLPNYKYATTWPLLREAQLSMLKYPSIGLAVTIDVGNPEDIHPSNKAIVGKRLYRAARKVAYEEDTVVFSGPIYDRLSIEGDRVTVHFTQTGTGLIALGADTLKGFEVAGMDKVFFPGTASITADSLIIHSREIAKPVAIRYAWAANPSANLYNKEGLPASPFRTDNW